MFATPAHDAPLKAVDFGIAVFCTPGQFITTRAGTRIVMAPEVVREHYTLSADLWSAGVVAYLLLTGRMPFPFWETMFKLRKVGRARGGMPRRARVRAQARRHPPTHTCCERTPPSHRWEDILLPRNRR